MRLGGFVIHGDSAPTLGACLEGLAAVCDDVVAVDSGSGDGSSEVARAAGARRVSLPWRGYGAARAAAVAALEGSDYVFFLDSDEHLLPPAVESIRRWRARGPAAPYGRLLRRNWAELDGRRFVFTTERQLRLVRRDEARWTPSMIVHETLPRGPAVEDLDAWIEHRFVDASGDRRDKDEQYALLWAVRALDEGWRRKRPGWQRVAHAARAALLKGALFRGGWRGASLAWSAARYHERKYQLLAQLQRGAHPELIAALRAGRLEELVARAAATSALTHRRERG